MTAKTEAERVAEWLESGGVPVWNGKMQTAARELRRLHAEVERLTAMLGDERNRLMFFADELDTEEVSGHFVAEELRKMAAAIRAEAKGE